MKKIYNTPSVKVVVLSATPILAGSTEIDNNPITGDQVGAKDGYRFDLLDEDFE